MAKITKTEQLFLDAVEAGLRDSPHDVRQAAMRLRRLAGRSDVLSSEAIERLDSLMADPEAAMRAATPTASPRALEPSFRGTSVSSDPGLAAEIIEGASAPVLPPAIADRLARLIREQAHVDRLVELGIRPTSSVLLSGPPGVGKTHTARWLASELGLPLVHIEPAVVLSSLLGRSGQNLVAQLEHAKREQAVVLIDEFDALAKHRDDASDIGELKRLVTVLLLELDRWPSGQLLIAATNHPHLLDPAIRRRFDQLIEFPLPDLIARTEILAVGFDARKIKLPSELVRALANASEGRHGGALSAMCDEVARSVYVEQEDPTAAAAEVLASILDSDGGDRENIEDAYCWAAHRFGGVSFRELATRIGVTHPTVGKRVQRFSEKVA